MPHKPDTPAHQCRSHLTIDTYLVETFTPDANSPNAPTIQDKSESDGLELSRIDSWVEQRFTQLDIEEAAWTPEPSGESGPSGCRGRVGMARLDRWMEKVEQAKKKRNREGTEWQERRNRYRGYLMEVLGRQSNDAVPLAMERQDLSKGPRRSCASDKLKAKKGGRLFRARRRVANLFREVQKSVESVIAMKRFEVH